MCVFFSSFLRACVLFSFSLVDLSHFLSSLIHLISYFIPSLIPSFIVSHLTPIPSYRAATDTLEEELLAMLGAVSASASPRITASNLKLQLKSKFWFNESNDQERAEAWNFGSVSGSTGVSVSVETDSVFSHVDSGGNGWLEGIGLFYLYSTFFVWLLVSAHTDTTSISRRQEV